MPKRDHAPTGAPCWVDLSTSDVERSRDFYTQLFGWDAGTPSEEFGGYFDFTKDGVDIAGCMAAMPDAPTDVWSVYLATDDARKTLESASSHGGQVIVEAMDVADLGTMGFMVDPGGGAVGVWQPGQHLGFGRINETGAPSWFELLTGDYAASVDFYTSVFGWETRVIGDSDELRYTAAVHGEEMLAGIMDASAFLPEGATHWSVYFGVDDADATLAKVTELGGSVVRAAEDTPYGRLAEAADPCGARFKIVAGMETGASDSSST